MRPLLFPPSLIGACRRGSCAGQYRTTGCPSQKSWWCFHWPLQQHTSQPRPEPLVYPSPFLYDHYGPNRQPRLSGKLRQRQASLPASTTQVSRDSGPPAFHWRLSALPGRPDCSRYTSSSTPVPPHRLSLWARWGKFSMQRPCPANEGFQNGIMPTDGLVPADSRVDYWPTATPHSSEGVWLLPFAMVICPTTSCLLYVSTGASALPNVRMRTCLT